MTYIERTWPTVRERVLFDFDQYPITPATLSNMCQYIAAWYWERGYRVLVTYDYVPRHVTFRLTDVGAIHTVTITGTVSV